MSLRASSSIAILARRSAERACLATSSLPARATFSSSLQRQAEEEISTVIPAEVVEDLSLPFNPVFDMSELSRPPKKTSRQPNRWKALDRETPLPKDDPTTAALNAVAARLDLPESASMAPKILQCLTHHSYSDDKRSTNQLLAETGRAIVNFVLSEYYAKKYPNLPIRTLETIMTALSCKTTMWSVGSDLGVGSRGLPLRYQEITATTAREHAEKYREKTRHMDLVMRKADKKAHLAEHPPILEDKYLPDAQASVVRAFVGLIYEEKGLGSAAAFINAHFISRHVNLESLLKFEQPQKVLENTVIPFGLTKPVPRLIAETGRMSATPNFLVGYFSDEIKLGEGHGSSLAMAKHRAATAALHTLYLTTTPGLPTLSIGAFSSHPHSTSPAFALERKYATLAPPIGETETLAFSAGLPPSSSDHVPIRTPKDARIEWKARGAEVKRAALVRQLEKVSPPGADADEFDWERLEIEAGRPKHVQMRKPGTPDQQPLRSARRKAWRKHNLRRT